MSRLKESSVVKKFENSSEMKTCKSSLVNVGLGLTCGRCAMLYSHYKHLLEHLYWRHGTESSRCRLCGLKRWHYAAHVCHVLPINDDQIVEDGSGSDFQYFERESDYCFCGKYMEDTPMIGCDGPHCVLQWYHFGCVGVVSPPDGKWLCPKCNELKQTRRKYKRKHVEIKT